MQINGKTWQDLGVVEGTSDGRESTGPETQDGMANDTMVERPWLEISDRYGGTVGTLLRQADGSARTSLEAVTDEDPAVVDAEAQTSLAGGPSVGSVERPSVGESGASSVELLKAIGKLLNKLLSKILSGTPNSGQPALDLEHIGEPTIAYCRTENAELFDDDGPSCDDIVQGDTGDCYFLATLAAVAERNPQFIKDMIRGGDNGIYEVRFYHEGKPVWISVDSSFARYDGTDEEVYAQALDSDGDGLEEIWVALLEKAFAKFNDTYGVVAEMLDDPGAASDVGYEGIGNGGFGTHAYEWITGEPADFALVEELRKTQVWELLSAD